MITRFKIEAEAETKEQVEKDLNFATIEIQDRFQHSEWNQDRFKWEKTQDVVSGRPGAYKGRVNFVYRSENV